MGVKTVPFLRYIAIILLLAGLAAVGGLPAYAETELPAQEETADSRTSGTEDKETLRSRYTSSLIEYYGSRIKTAYKDLLKSTGRDDFRGYCAMYVNNLLVYYGINTKYIKGNANTLYATYSKLLCTSGGYTIEALSAKDYTLKEALCYFSSDTPVESLIVVFSKGATEKGKLYGHTFFVNAIIGDTVVFSDSAPWLYEGEIIEDGDPIVCSIDDVCEKYEYYKFEGIVHFTSQEKQMFYPGYWRSIDCGDSLCDSLRTNRLY